MKKIAFLSENDKWQVSVVCDQKYGKFGNWLSSI